MPQIENGILFTDQYQLTMAQLYFENGFHENEVTFDHFFRSYPDYGKHRAGYCINAGLKSFLEWFAESRFRDQEIEAIKSQKDDNGKKIFSDKFIDYLRNNWSLDNVVLHSFPEGSVVHKNEPITIYKGPLLVGQIIETGILNMLNHQILIATKAARVKYAAKGNPVLEFGARRAHDKGANAGARAALIGGADFTSNVGISYKLGYPPKGTHAHSMIQFFLAKGYSELDAFQAYADIYPDNSILLVDTINTLKSGIPNAIKVFEKLKSKGHQPAGIRLDSGNLAELSVKAAKMLNDAGFEKTKIVLSSDLDEYEIIKIHERIKELSKEEQQDSDEIIGRLVYGVGTRLITSEGDSSLGGVFKLSGLIENEKVKPIIKISDSEEKTNNPGYKNVLRVYDEDKAVADLLTLREENVDNDSVKNEFKKIDPGKLGFETRLEKVFENGKILWNEDSIEKMRERKEKDLSCLKDDVKDLISPKEYEIKLSSKLLQTKKDLLKEMSS